MVKTKKILILCVSLVFLLTFSFSPTRSNQIPYYVYLPISQFNLVPPVNTYSYYITNIGSSEMFELGCNLGIAVRTREDLSVLTLLQFGNAQINDGQYGVNIYGLNFPFHTMDEVSDAAYTFSQGYGLCTNPDSPILILAIGINNQGDSFTLQHGGRWGAMVSVLGDRLNATPTGYKIIPIVGGDIELEFNTSSKTSNWISGVFLTSDVVLYNYGALGGCPAIDVPGEFDGDCTTLSRYCPKGICSWRQSDVWNITVKENRIRVVPQVYSNDGHNAQQWYQLALYGYRTSQSEKLTVRGTLTQYEACQQVNHQDLTCPFLDNTPNEGWLQLTEALRQNPLTMQNIIYSTDIRWQE